MTRAARENAAHVVAGIERNACAASISLADAFCERRALDAVATGRCR
jgi:hypothetical protein